MAAFILGGLLGASAFILIWGITPLDPFNVMWMVTPYGSDPSFAEIGSLDFLKEAWTFPLGLIRGLVHPSPTSIVYVDGIPWVALVAKIFATFIHRDFQYVGLWGFACAILQGGLGSLIIRRYSKDSITSTIGAGFLILSPFFLGKMFGHISMSGQWVLLSAILLIFSRDSNRVIRNEIPLWIGLCTISVGILAYFVPMVFSLMVLYYWLRARNIGIRAVYKLLISLIGSILACALALWLLGGFLSNTDVSANDYGIAPFNLNNLFNPGAASRVIKSFPVGTSGGESYSWLGLGVILGGIYLSLDAAFRSQKTAWQSVRYWAPFLVVCSMLILYAATNKIMFGDEILLEYRLPKAILSAFSTFRTSGRFIWPVWYLIVIFVIGSLCRKPTEIWRRDIILVALLAVQIYDGFAIHGSLNKFRGSPVTAEQLRAPPPLAGKFWTEMSDVKHVIFAPAVAGGKVTQEAWGYIAYQAVKQRITMNTFWLGRYPMKAVQENIHSKIEELKKGNIGTGDLIVVNVPDMLAQVNFSGDITPYWIDDEIVLGKPGLDKAGEGIVPISIHKTSLADYLDHLATLGPESTIFMTARSNQTPVSFDEATLLATQQLGIGHILDGARNFSYVGVQNSKQHVNFESMDPIHASYVLKKGDKLGDISYLSDVNISIDNDYNKLPTILINGEDFSENFIGMNICVYDNATGLVSEVATFNLYAMTGGVVIKF